MENPSMRSGEPWPERLIAAARRGDDAAQGRLLELYRNYLRLVARSLIGGALRVKLDASDLVQETFLKARRDFGGFAGGTERELVAWLWQILVRSLANQVKHHRRRARDQNRQESLDHLLELSDRPLRFALAARLPSPSEAASRREQAVLLADAVDRLPADYREAFVLRTLEHVPFEEIALRMGRSTGAVRMLWARAVKKLNEMLEEAG
jgi:RNA polymerase sigma-70 factor (ECF subfamily)